MVGTVPCTVASEVHVGGRCVARTEARGQWSTKKLRASSRNPIRNVPGGVPRRGVR
jgi:hypothetical protein